MRSHDRRCKSPTFFFTGCHATCYKRCLGRASRAHTDGNRENPFRRLLMKKTCFIAIALLTRLALPASSQAQEKCKWETVEVSADAERKARLQELQHEMKPEFTFTIGDTGVLTHRELTGAKPPDAASLRRQMERQHELAKQAGVAELTKKPLPAVFDWLKRGKVSNVKCQWCEDCWAFAAAAVIE